MVAGEIDLTAAERDDEGEDQATAADAAADDQPEQAGPSGAAARARRSAPLPTDDDADMEVTVTSNSTQLCCNLDCLNCSRRSPCLFQQSCVIDYMQFRTKAIRNE